MPDSKTVLFIHNINSGVLQPLHNYSSTPVAVPGADTCSLSNLTRSPVGIKKEWKRFLKDLSIPSRSLDRNEFFSEFGHRDITIPVVLLQSGTELLLLISTEEINRCHNLGDLIQLVRERLPGA